ncbi:hypothetical protein BME96_08865 [Virgibacillus halodenitrificans]|uniref:Uncharacterized protein n=1 Tax=Virgibacillus halodenitrificans TaxID=1482 RepID=A0AAC9IZ66_VIRHA|nr:hypothetical protein [Virgibacillus halodenitrificans]APC48272.1 hypothetical protein BME96_08865 [Virgibacillus halodenitrificans]
MTSKIQDNYPPEDFFQASDELVNIQKNCLKLLDSAIEAQFSGTDRILADLEQGIKVLKAFNHKKLKREEHKDHVYARRN